MSGRKISGLKRRRVKRADVHRAIRSYGGEAAQFDRRLARPERHAWPDHLRDQFHHIGTARMNDSPRQGVVDQNCRVHGIDNLYIGSSAVFPTGGHSNPTLTIIALCMRLSDRLKRELA